jgi:hypothetical protein
MNPFADHDPRHSCRSFRILKKGTRVSPLLIFPMKSILLTLVSLLFAATAHAHWQDVSYTFKNGWNAIYLHGDASYTTPATLFASYPEVTEVWRWNPNPTQVQFTDSPQIPSAGTPEWSTWKRDGSVTSLSKMVGQSAYLVKCSSASPSPRALRQRAMPPSATWVRSGANLLGFPSFATGSTFPTFASYFATFPAAVATDTKVYKYVGGELGAGNPMQVFSAATERVDRNQAYWFQSAVVGNFYAPIEITSSNSNGLDFGKSGSVISVMLRNRTSATVTVNMTTAPSLAAPPGQTTVTGPVSLIRYNADDTQTAWSIGTQVVGPQATVEVKFGVNRSGMTGSNFYASLLRFTESASLLDVSLPVSASATSMAGLWIGDAQVSAVTSKASYKDAQGNVVKNAQGEVVPSPGATTPRSFPLRFMIHVDASGTARLLSQVFMGTLASAGNPVGLCTKEAGLKQDAKADARRLSVTHLPLDTVNTTGTGSVALGSSLVRTVSIPFTDPTNPFVHSYHPDHDNLDARPDGTRTLLANGVESHTITRTCTFQFTTTPPAGTSTTGWGSSVIGGTYSETLKGLHKDTAGIAVSGNFILRRASEEAALTVN